MYVIKISLLFLFCFLFAMIPEIGMYIAWGLIDPQTALAKIATMALFWFGGVGMSIVFGYVGFTLWVIGLDTIK